MDILSVQGLLAMLQIIVIDILLAGDNAIVIGMAARNLPVHLQKKAIFWGTAGAIILRLVMAFLFVEALNNIPALRLVGGILLLWIGYKLVADDESEHNIEAKDNLRAAITTIVIADGIMGIDNVIGVVGAKPSLPAKARVGHLHQAGAAKVGLRRSSGIGPGTQLRVAGSRDRQSKAAQ